MFYTHTQLLELRKYLEVDDSLVAAGASQENQTFLQWIQGAQLNVLQLSQRWWSQWSSSFPVKSMPIIPHLLIHNEMTAIITNYTLI